MHQRILWTQERKEDIHRAFIDHSASPRLGTKHVSDRAAPRGSSPFAGYRALVVFHLWLPNPCGHV